MTVSVKVTFNQKDSDWVLRVTPIDIGEVYGAQPSTVLKPGEEATFNVWTTRTLVISEEKKDEPPR